MHFVFIRRKREALQSLPPSSSSSVLSRFLKLGRIYLSCSFNIISFHAIHATSSCPSDSHDLNLRTHVACSKRKALTFSLSSCTLSFKAGDRFSNGTNHRCSKTLCVMFSCVCRSPWSVRKRCEAPLQRKAVFPYSTRHSSGKKNSP